MIGTDYSNSFLTSRVFVLCLATNSLQAFSSSSLVRISYLLLLHWQQQAMERIPAACAMEWSIELEKALRSKKSGEPVKAIERFGPRLCWWSREPEPTKAVHDMFGLVPGEDRLFANAILLCLADAFRLGDRDARLSVVRVFLLELKQRRGKKKCKQYKGILSKARVYNQLELLKRVKIVFDIGDVESRALALVLFGCWADFAKDNVHIRYLILSSLVSTDLLQVKSALFAAGCFCELAGDFASVALEMLINMLTFSETPSVIRLAGVRVFAKMGCSYSIASSAYKIGLKLVLDSTEEDFLVAMLVSLSKIAFKSTLLLSEQVGLLLSFLSRKQTLRMQATALRCLCFVFMGRACHPSLSTRVIKTLFNTLHDTELPSAMQCEALYILHKIFSCGLPSLAEDNMLEFTHLLTVVEKSTPSTISNNLVFRVLVDVSMLFRERKEMQSGEDACSSLLVRIISVITDRIILLVKPLWNLHRPNTLVVQDIRGLFSLLLSLVLKYPDLGVLVLDRIRLFVLELVDIQEGDVVTRQAHVLADKTTDFGAEGSASSREKLLHMVHKFCVTCIGKLSDVGAIKTQIFYQVKLLVECVHQCRVFDYYTHTIFSVLLHSESMWNFAVKDKDSCLDSNLCSSLRSYLVEKEVFSLESANRMLEEIDKWPAYKAGIFAACQGAWVTAAFIFDQLTSKAQRESSSYWLKLLALFTQFESKIQLFIMPQLSSSLVDRSKGLDFAMHFSEKFGESNQRARQNITEPNYSKMLVGVYFSTSKETFESIIKSNKSFCFQRWFLVLRAKVLGTVLDLLNVLEAIPLNQSTGSQKGEVEWLNSLQQITEFSFRLKRLSQEYDLVATSFIDMDSRSSNIMSALALSCSVLAFASGFALFVSNLPASETLKPNDPEKSNSSRGQLIQSLVARLWLIDQETCSNLCQLLEVSGNCHLQPRNKILNIAGEVREILNVCNCVVCGIAGLQKRATGVQNKEILSEVTRDCLVLLLNAITKYLHIPFQVPKYFFKVRPLVGSELFVYHADSRNPIELSVQPGFHLSLNLCFQLKNLPPDLSSHVTKSYCILCSSTSFQESVSNQSSHEQVHMDYEFWETDCIIKQNEKLKCYVTESARKKRHTDKEFGRDDGIVHSFVCFELNDSGQGFSNCLLDVSNFPVGSYRIKWYSCCIDSRGCYRSLLALNAGPMFTVTPPSSVSI